MKEKMSKNNNMSDGMSNGMSNGMSQTDCHGNSAKATNKAKNSKSIKTTNRNDSVDCH